MKETLARHLQISLALLAIACAIVGSVWLTHYNQKTLEQQILEQRAGLDFELTTLAEITDRNGADASIENIVTDCPRRDEYETLLIKLSSLTKKDLIIVQNLYESCGNFYAERKALMVGRLERELKSYEDMTDLLRTLDVKEVNDSRLATWKSIVSLEKTRSSLLTEQSAIQSKIISYLVTGYTEYSKEVSELTRNAQEIGELLTVHDHRIDELRASLMN